MKIIRTHLRKIILKEAKRVLSNDIVFENILLNLLDSEDIDTDIEKVMSSRKVEILDDLLELEEFKSRLKSLDSEKVLELLSKLRGSVSASTFNRIKEIVIENKPEIEDQLLKM
tara:strand:- start:517 stop:858 length:342 start_codon:yes stop_codon:yes gene_type:complete